jgi:transglutaminase-like putative cysteine protease
MHYAIRHVTKFTYETAVRESLMEVRMQPRSDEPQRCLRFELGVSPRTRVLAYRDHFGNSVHHFDIPHRHHQLTITARAHVQVEEGMLHMPPALSMDAWDEVDAWQSSGEHWDFHQPSHFASWTPALVEFASSHFTRARQEDPLTTVRKAMRVIHDEFEYVPKSTRVDSPIDEALLARRGVCQDFAHIMLAMTRWLGLPCRYVSGYIAPRPDNDRAGLIASATHAWVEVLLPGLDWVGMDPTNNSEAPPRHIRVAVGRDYRDVPPTRGVFKGSTRSSLTVSVDVAPSDAPAALEPLLPEPQWATLDLAPAADPDYERQLQMQQQQQQ